MRISEVFTEERVAAEQRAISLSHPTLSVEERRRLLMARNHMLYLPTHGVDGQVVSRVAAEVGVSRNYVYNVLFPDDPNKLFGMGTGSQLVWSVMAEMVFNHRLYDQMRKSFDAIRTRGQLIVTARKPIISFMIRRCKELGFPVLIQSQDGTCKATYRLVRVGITDGFAR